MNKKQKHILKELEKEFNKLSKKELVRTLIEYVKITNQLIKEINT